MAILWHGLHSASSEWSGTCYVLLPWCPCRWYTHARARARTHYTRMYSYGITDTGSLAHQQGSAARLSAPVLQRGLSYTPDSAGQFFGSRLSCLRSTERAPQAAADGDEEEGGRGEGGWWWAVGGGRGEQGSCWPEPDRSAR